MLNLSTLLERSTKNSLMSLNSFLSELALANFDIQVKEQKNKLWKLQESVRWEQQKQRFLSSLCVLLESTQLQKEELRYVLTGISEDGPEVLLEKIKFVNDRLPEVRDPRKQFVERQKILG